jgi:hypothetical protein
MSDEVNDATLDEGLCRATGEWFNNLNDDVFLIPGALRTFPFDPQVSACRCARSSRCASVVVAGDITTGLTTVGVFAGR